MAISLQTKRKEIEEIFHRGRRGLRGDEGRGAEEVRKTSLDRAADDLSGDKISKMGHSYVVRQYRKEGKAAIKGTKNGPARNSWTNVIARHADYQRL